MTDGVLALDIASRTGWAYASAEQVAAWPLVPMASAEHPKPVFGEIRVTEGMDGAVWCRWQDDLTSLLQMHGPAAIAYEAALPPNAASGAEAAVLLHTLQAFARYTAARWRLLAVSANVQTVRKHFLGQARFSNRKEAKAAVIDGCRRRGWSPKTDNQADALAVLDWAIADLRARQAA